MRDPADQRLIMVGVTGHRDLRPEDLTALETAVRAELTWLQTLYPYAPMRLLTGLAEGADQLCARVARLLGMDLVAVLPWPVETFRKDFSGEALTAFDTLLAACASVLVAPQVEPYQDTPEYAYRQVGLYIARHSQVLVALWDGQPPKPGGCGTAETVAFMLDRHAAGLYGEAPAPEEAVVLHILTPRRSNPVVGEVAMVRAIGLRSDE